MCVEKKMDAETIPNPFLVNHQTPLLLPSSPTLSPHPPTTTAAATTAVKPTTTNDISIFPPINHEGLPIPRPPHAPLSLVDSYDQLTSLLSTPSPPPPQPPPPQQPPRELNCTPTSTSTYTCQSLKLFHFALQFCNAHLSSFPSRLTSSGLFSSFRLLAVTIPFAGLFWLWFRRRRRKPVISTAIDSDTVAQLKAIIKDKDEKIIQLLEQIAEMNKLLLARYRFPVIKPT